MNTLQGFNQFGEHAVPPRDMHIYSPQCISLDIKSLAMCTVCTAQCTAVFWIRIFFSPDPDPAKNLNPDPEVP